MKKIVESVKINHVMIVDGGVICQSWRGEMQVVYTNIGIFIDNLKGVQYKGIYGYDWNTFKGKEVEAVLKYGVINKCSGLDNWINYEK